MKERISLNDPRLRKTSADEYMQSLADLLEESQISPASKAVLFEKRLPVAMNSGHWVIDTDSDTKKSLIYLALSAGVIWNPKNSPEEEIKAWKNDFIILCETSDGKHSALDTLLRTGIDLEGIQDAFAEINWYCEGFSFSSKLKVEALHLRFRNNDIVSPKNKKQGTI